MAGEIAERLKRAGLPFLNVFVLDLDADRVVEIVLASTECPTEISSGELLRIVNTVSEVIGPIRDWQITLDYTVGVEDEVDEAFLSLVIYGERHGN